MSRSYKKPHFTDQQNSKTKFIKRKANKKVRKQQHIGMNGSSYKKEFDSWDIRDWSFYCPKDKKAYRK